MNPNVCAILLTADRPKFTDRAIKAFYKQTYGRCSLLVWDSGVTRYEPDLAACGPDCKLVYDSPDEGNKTIGRLRNLANDYADGQILMHWDSDDWSAPTRMEEQVKFLIESGKQAVGYSQMLFWDSTKAEAWLYTSPQTNYCIGTSLCYWRETWEKQPLKGDTSIGEEWDTRWAARVSHAAVSSLTNDKALSYLPSDMSIKPAGNPRLIAEVHGGNTACRIVPGTDEWKRVPQWDERLRETMKL